MFLVLAAITAFAFPGAGPQLKFVGYDPLNIPGVEDSVAVGPVLATNGFITVSAYQIGRFTGDAAAGMAFSTSYDGGNTWNENWLPGLTKAQNASNPYDRITYQSLAWDQRYQQFLAVTLPILNTPQPQYGESDTTLPPVVNRSSDGYNWSGPQPVSTGAGEIRPEKSYVACDNSLSSRYYGNCYVAWDDNDNNDAFHAAVSTDGGKTWGPTVGSANGHSSFGGQPVILPNGTVVVTSEDSSGYDGTEANIISFVSTNGGATWSSAYEVSPITTHAVAGSLRTQSLPTTAVDASGLIYTIWQDCRFRTACSSNDLVLSESRDGLAWSPTARIPLDAVTSGADHFLPTLAVRNSFSGPYLGLSYYGYPQANCTAATCALDAYYANESPGNGWSTPKQLAGPFNTTWFAATGAGYMLGDYFESVYPSSGYFAPLVTATAPSGTPAYHEYAYVGLSLNNGFYAKSAIRGIVTANAVTKPAGAVEPAKFNAPHLAPWHKTHHGKPTA